MTPQLGACSHISHHGHRKTVLPLLVSSGSRITSHLSQDYSSDLLFPLKQMNSIRTNAAETSNSLLMFQICQYLNEFLDVCIVLTLFAEIEITHK